MQSLLQYLTNPRRPSQKPCHSTKGTTPVIRCRVESLTTEGKVRPLRSN